MIARKLICAALLMAASTPRAAAQDDEPIPQTFDDEILYAATCINAGMLLKQFGTTEGAEEAVLLDRALGFWLRRHEALEPDEEARKQQWVVAAELIVESTGAEPEGIEPALMVIMANCQARRADLVAEIANPDPQ